MSARDELALDIFLADNSNIPEGELRQDWADAPDHHRPYAQNIADGLIAKSYHKPRTVTTVEELATLSRGAVLVSPFWTDAYSYVGDESSPTKVQNITTGACTSVSESDDFLPAAVIHEFAWATR